jgi:hypothetical protein
MIRLTVSLQCTRFVFAKPIYSLPVQEPTN